MRATIENNLLYDGGKRMWYMGPMFRHERPQRGRYRQFHQIGAEALGFAGPDVDAELILLAVSLWKRLGLTQWRLEINSLGQPEERKAHREALIAYLEQHTDVMDEEAKRRMYSNPCVCWTPRTLPCRRWSMPRPSCWIIWAKLRWPTSTA